MSGNESKNDTRKKKVVLVLCSGELDRALACMNIAVGAASMGMEVVVFCTFFGLNAIRKEGWGKVRAKPGRAGLFGAGAIRRAFALVNRGGGRFMNPSRFSFGGLGRRLMAYLMRDSKVANLDELMELAAKLGVRIIACSTSFDVLGLTKESLRPEVKDVAGVATFLAEAADSDVNLFI